MKKLLLGCVLCIVFLVLVVFGLGVLGMFFSNKSRPEAVKAGEHEFSKANGLITGSSKGTFHGNNAEASKYARDYSFIIKLFDQKMFSGGKKNRKVSLTKDNFLTYCQLNNDSVVFLVHVPQFKRYKGNVRDELINMSWRVAETIVNESNLDKKIDIVVGLRGAIFYGGRAFGRSGNPPMTENDFSIDEDVFYKYFIVPEKNKAGEEEEAKKASNMIDKTPGLPDIEQNADAVAK